MGFFAKMRDFLLGTPYHVPTMTPDQVAQIKELDAEGLYTQKELGLMFGIDQSQVSRILSGKSHASPK